LEWYPVGKDGTEDLTPEAHDKYSLPMLWHPPCGIHNLRVDFVAQLIQRLLDDTPSLPTVMGPEVLHVLEEHHGRLLGTDDTRHGEEQVSLFDVCKSVSEAERDLLGDTRNRERLAGEAS